jgi:hypothetical protein
VDKPLKPESQRLATLILSSDRTMKISTPAYVKFLRQLPLSQYIAHTAIILCTLVPTAWGDALKHIDGTLVEGTIVSETTETIRIKTQYGIFTYPRSEIREITRPVVVTPTPAPVVTPTPTPVNFLSDLPRGPINPFAPPRNLPNLTERGAPYAPVTSAPLTAIAPLAPTPAVTPDQTPVAPVGLPEGGMAPPII